MNAQRLLVVEAVDLSVVYPTGNSVKSLDRVRLTIQAGEVAGLLGKSGAGKTTLLRTLAGGLAPTEGRLWIDPKLAAAGGIRAALQGETLIDGKRSLEENLAAGGTGRTAGEWDDRLLPLLDLDRDLRTRIERLPQAVQDRAALAAAFRSEAGLFLLDELPGLDLDSARRLQSWLPGWAHGLGKTVLLATRSPAVAVALCDRVVVLAQGRVTGDRAIPECCQTADSQPARYQVRVAGQLDPARSSWFAGWEVVAAGGDTLISGEIRDQPALHGLLARVRDLGLPLVSLTCLDGSIEAELARLME